VSLAGGTLLKNVQAADAARGAACGIYRRDHLFFVYHFGDRPEFGVRRLFGSIFVLNVEIHFNEGQRFTPIKVRHRYWLLTSTQPVSRNVGS
jgi:hypothetical protein